MSDTKTQRYTLTSGAIVATHNTFDGSPIGEWVRWEDFAASQAEVERLAEFAERLLVVHEDRAPELARAIVGQVRRALLDNPAEPGA